MTVDGLPDVLELGKVAECIATVRNRSARSMTLQLQFRTDGMVGVYVHGQSFRNLGQFLLLASGVSFGCPSRWGGRYYSVSCITPRALLRSV